MAKFYGVIGYATPVESAPGVHTIEIKRIPCKGDILRNVVNATQGDRINDNITIVNRFSIIADAYAYANIPNLKYIEWNETKWKITSVDVQRPRIILSVGGVYNG